MGCMFWLFTALGTTIDRSRLRGWYPKVARISSPAADISAPESGKTDTSFVPT